MGGGAIARMDLPLLAMARSFYDGSAIRYVLLVLWMTSRFHNSEWAESESSSSPSKVAIRAGCEVCRLRLHVVSKLEIASMHPAAH